MGKNRQSQKTKVKSTKWSLLLLAIFAGLYVANQIGIIDYDKIQATIFGSQAAPTAKEEIDVHYIDVGQGDSTLIITENSTVLIDAGEYSEADKVVSYINQLGIKKLDVVIATHPHSDHIGGMSKVIENFEIDTLYMPFVPDDMIPSGYAYERFIQAMLDNDVNAAELTESLKLTLDDALFEFFPPPKEYTNLNNYSILTRLTHGENTFLFSGDAESDAEADHLANNANLSARVYKAGHHGSNTSSSEDFLNAVSPEICVISCGAGNSYKHPGEKAVKRMQKHSNAFFRTDLMGTIIINSNGKDLKYTYENR